MQEKVKRQSKGELQSKPQTVAELRSSLLTEMLAHVDKRLLPVERIISELRASSLSVVEELRASLRDILSVQSEFAADNDSALEELRVNLRSSLLAEVEKRLKYTNQAIDELANHAGLTKN